MYIVCVAFARANQERVTRPCCALRTRNNYCPWKAAAERINKDAVVTIECLNNNNTASDAALNEVILDGMTD